MEAQQTNMDTIANNLANANTTGFKQSRANFADLMYQTLIPAGANNANNTQVPTGIQIGMGVKTGSVEKIFSQGNFTQTGNNLDMAVQGNGFFEVLRGNQLAYTRDGSFKVDASGNVVDADGYMLQPQVTLPQTAVSVSIDPSGVLTATDATGKVVLNTNLQLFLFPNPAGLQAVGNNYYIPTPASGNVTATTPGGPDGAGTILQGYLEASNTNVVDDMVNMILSQRSYEANSKVIKSADQMMQMANNVVS
jgi:flagellar basal-body rod protein FlgG